ncbi:MAG: cytochrome c-type biogenesis protein CcmH [Rhizobiales bacterium]|nr:cytochrome c-type biogenesis protein CcmH [Hyphomicrobiales bacterium]
MNRTRTILALLLSAWMALPAFAVQPDEVLKDPALEQRARNISAGLRCLVCQNQSIDESDAGVARDLRILIREQLLQQKTDDQIITFVVDRYGDYVLLKPRFKRETLILWLAPFVVLVAGGIFVLRRRATPVAPVEGLTEAEKARLDDLVRK